MRVLVIVLALALAPTLALAQEHEHRSDKGVALVLHDGPANGRAVVGAYTHFGFALLDKDAAPTPHQNAEFSVVQNGRVVFSTEDTHEYDGLFSLDVRFTEPGPYQVLASSGEMALGTFEGEVVEPANATVATIDLVATPQGPASRIVDFQLSILDPAGAIIPHTDAIIEIRNARDRSLASRTHLHIHDEPIRFSQGFGGSTDYVASVVGYLAFATGRSGDVPAVAAEFPFTAGVVSEPGVPMPEAAAPSPLEQVGGKASADGRTLHLMYDPNQQIGVGQTARIAAIVTEDANHTFLPHVDFALDLQGPRGLAFSTASGHEYDGMFEYVFVAHSPGFFDGAVTATYGDTVLSVPVHLQVVPPAIPLLGGTGLVDVTVDGLEGLVAGTEATLTFAAASAAGPAKHSEVDVTIFHEGEPPLYQFKLHTHDSGLTNAVVRLPHEGAWQMRIDPLPTVPEASLYPPVLLAFDVAPGEEMEKVVDGVASASDPKLTVPAVAPWAILLVALAVATRRR